MTGHLYYFRPGEEARMMARCQFGASLERGAGACLTYPIKGYPWRRNPVRHYTFPMSAETTRMLFHEVRRIRVEYPEHCLGNDHLWSDHSEKANGITRDMSTGTLCHTIGIWEQTGTWAEYYSLREDSDALISSKLFRVISDLIAPHEKL